MNDGTQNTESISFYIWSILYITAISGLVVSIVKRKKHRILKNFPLYFSFFLCVLISGDIYEFFLPKAKFRLDMYIDYFFTLAELIIFSDFFYKILISSISKKTIKIFTRLFIVFSLISVITNVHFYNMISQNTRNRIYTTEAIILIIFCIFYYFEIFKHSVYPNLINEPSFWIVTGLSFFMICTLPYSLMEIYLLKNFKSIGFQLYTIFYVFYILLFLMIITAFACKKNKAI